METATSKQKSADYKRIILCLVTSIVVTVAVFPFAASFSVPVFYTYIQLPGVLLFVANAVVSSICFFRCPRRPVWAKALVLLLALPSLYFAVFSVLYYPPLHIGGR
jgi:hypothetical protein